MVAEEVRKLAEQSQEAAKQIAFLIGEIQGETDNAVAAMDVGAREVKAGTEVVNAAGQTFQDIIALVSQLAEQVAGISAAIRQLAGGSETQTVSAATQEQSAVMEEIAVSSQNLAKMAQDLQDAVDKFRI